MGGKKEAVQIVNIHVVGVAFDSANPSASDDSLAVSSSTFNKVSVVSETEATRVCVKVTENKYQLPLGQQAKTVPLIAGGGC